MATSTVREVARQGRLLTLLNRREISARRGLIVSGLPATGKSTALKQLGRTHELMVRERYPGAGRIPVVYVTTPPKGSPRKLAMEFARFLGLPPVRRGQNTTDIADAVCQVLIDARADLVLVDEIHNLNLATSAGEDMSDHLKYFTEHLPATFVYAGVDVERSGLFTGVRGRQIAGRCVLISTGPFPLQAEWASLLATLEAALRLHRHRPGTLPRLGKYLHQRTGGMIGSLSHLVRAAALVAILDGTEEITRKLLDGIPVDHAAQSGAPRRGLSHGLAAPAAAAATPGRAVPRRDDHQLPAPPRRTANRIDPAGLRYLLARSDRNGRAGAARPARRHHRACPAPSLAYAMPQICTAAELAGLHIASRPRARDGMVVRRLPALRGGPPVTRWALHDDVVCGRHRRWISKYHAQPDLTAQPEILHAHRRHRRLIRRHGRDPVMRALPRRPAHLHRLAPRRAPRPRLRPPHGDLPRPRLATTATTGRPSTSDAATYPQSVALTRLLASPYWRERILGNDWAGHDEFTAELRRTVAPGYTWDYRPRTRWRRDRDDPLLEWRLHTRRLANSSRSRRAIPGTCPKPSRPAVAVTSTSITRKLRHDSGQRDIPVP